MVKRAPLNLDAVKASKPAALTANRQSISVASGQDVPEAKQHATAEAVQQNRTADARKAISLRLNPAAWRQLKFLAVDEETTTHALVIAAVNLLFEQRGKPPVA